jgi:hypothetical protein
MKTSFILLILFIWLRQHGWACNISSADKYGLMLAINQSPGNGREGGQWEAPPETARCASYSHYRFISLNSGRLFALDERKMFRRWTELGTVVGGGSEASIAAYLLESNRLSKDDSFAWRQFGVAPGKMAPSDPAPAILAWTPLSLKVDPVGDQIPAYEPRLRNFLAELVAEKVRDFGRANGTLWESAIGTIREEIADVHGCVKVRLPSGEMKMYFLQIPVSPNPPYVAWPDSFRVVTEESCSAVIKRRALPPFWWNPK